MKKLYWRPSGISRIQLLLIALVAALCLTAVEQLPRVKRQPYFAEKVAAARLASAAMAAIKEEKARRGIPIDPEADPFGSGMIGSVVTAVTSNTGHLPAKIMSTNPNFAAVVVALLKEAGVREGDVVALGTSGSFPAMNVAAYAALQTLKTKPIVISSASSSEWGATDEDYLWLDMEQTLYQKKLVTFRSVAASRGGIDDRGFGISRQGRALLDAAIERAQLPNIEPRSLPEAIEQRMNLYYEHAGDKSIAAYINVGGGSASVGTHVGKKLFVPGLNTVAPKGATDSVMTRFVQEGVPVIHISGIAELAASYGLPLEFSAPEPVGAGGVYARVEYNPWYASLGIAAILLTMFAFMRLDLRYTQNIDASKAAKAPASSQGLSHGMSSSEDRTTAPAESTDAVAPASRPPPTVPSSLKPERDEQA